MVLIAVVMLSLEVLKIRKDIQDGRKRVVTGTIEGLKITEKGIPAEFQLDYESKRIKIQWADRKSSYTALEPFDGPIQGGDSRSYLLVIDEKEYEVPRNEFFKHPVGSQFEGDFSMKGYFISCGDG
jgi:hypothetical protein